MQACNVMFTNIARACKKVQESYEGVLKCDVRADHDNDLMPFFLSNPELVMYFNSINKEGSRRIKVQEYLDSIDFVRKNCTYRNFYDEKFFHDHNIYYYEEDVQTRRLNVATKLCYTNVDVQYTVDLRGMACNSVLLCKMPVGTKLDIFLFHGSPDMLLQYKPIEVEMKSLPQVV